MFLKKDHSDQRIKYLIIYAKKLNITHLTKGFLVGLRLSEKSFLLINHVLNSAMGRYFHL